MKNKPCLINLCLMIPTLLVLLLPAICHAQATPYWEAFNDYSPGTLTDVNATGYKTRIDGDGGVLRDIVSGADLPVSVYVETEGGTPDDFGARGGAPDAGSPAMQLLGTKVDLSNDGLPGVRAAIKLTLVFSGLDPKKLYKFMGTAARGGGYNNRWSIYTITGAVNAVSAHLDGSANQNIITAASFPAAAADLGPNQVALNTGHNKQGSVVCWDRIEPAADGTFRVEALRYMGKTPFGDAPNSGTSYAYGLEAFYLAEFPSSGDLRITADPLSQKLPAGKTAVLSVTATSTQPISYQWQKAAPASTNFANITGATNASYTTPPLTVADDGSKFRCRLTSGASIATSGDAIINVDGVIPTIATLRGSVNFNAVYVSFSEPMKSDELAVATNYTLSGGVTVNSAQALDPLNVRLSTSKQAESTRYTLTINNIQDVAGNPVAANSSAPYTTYALTTNVVGLELWKNIGGSAVTDLRNSARYPAEPDLDYATATFDSFLVIPAAPDLNTYGGRFRAWLTPDESGEYEFFLRADDQGEFRISLDDKFDTLDDTNNVPDCADTSAGAFQEPGIDGSTSMPIQLVKGKKYAIQAIWKESNGGDYCQVAWRKVGDSTAADQLTPLPSNLLSYYGPVTVAEPPVLNSPVVQGTTVTITWSNGGTLYTAPAPNGPWTSTQDSDGSFQEPLLSSSRFYRVQK